MRSTVLLIACACASASNLHGMLGKTMSGDIKEMSEFEGKPVIMVNVASR